MSINTMQGLACVNIICLEHASGEAHLAFLVCAGSSATRRTGAQ